MALEAGKPFAVGVHYRMSAGVFLPDGFERVLEVYEPASGSLTASRGICRVRFEFNGAAGGSTWTAISWKILVQTAVDLFSTVWTTRGTITDPYVDPMLGELTAPGTNRERESWGFHTIAMACQMSTYNTDTGLFLDDGFLAVQLDGATIFSSSTLSLDRRLLLSQVRLATFQAMDVDALWIKGNTTFPTSYDVNGRPNDPLLDYWDFETGVPSGWEAGGTGGLPYDVNTAGKPYGANRTNGLSSWPHDPATANDTGLSVQVDHPGIRQTVFTTLVAQEEESAGGVPSCGVPRIDGIDYDPPPYPTCVGGGTTIGPRTGS